eukprot:COSAG05_NODE_2304_length_3250_cov_3.541098_2_plen_136_part_00
MQRDQRLKDQMQSERRTHLSAKAVSALKDCAKIGWLYKRGEHNSAWKKRWFELKNTKLSYYANPGDPVPKGEITVTMVEGDANAAGTRDSEHEFVFHLKSHGRTYVIAAETAAEKDEWLEKIDRTRKIITDDVLQ